jgi:hypothetical protein
MGEVLTGLLYLAPHAEDLHAHLNIVATPFNKLGEKDLWPGAGTSRRSTPLYVDVRVVVLSPFHGGNQGSIPCLER